MSDEYRATPSPPCDACARRVRCAAEAVECAAFRRYTGALECRWDPAEVGAELEPLGTGRARRYDGVLIEG